ncbi:MAG: hypothetical protein OXR73_38290 [Myxococcales bacterium]|nr:hypothetical protein [Myxococcales bacterium]
MMAGTLLKKSLEIRDAAATALEMRGQATTVRGTERHSGAPMTVRHVGLSDYFERMMRRILRDGYTVVSRRAFWNALAFAELRREPGPDLQLVHLPEAYCRLLPARALEMPCWSLQIVDLRGSWEDVTGRFRAKMRTTDLPKVRRQIRKHQLSYRVTRGERELREFYDEMYVPYARHRFGALADVDTYAAMQKDVRSDGGLLQIVCQQRVVAGSDFRRAGDTMEVDRFGALADLGRPLEDAVRSATYLFALEHAHRAGFRKLSLGATHPFLADGQFRFKRKWGAAVHATWMDSAFLWQPLTFGTPVRAFLSAHPMLVRTPRGLEGRILVNERVDARRFERLVHDLHSPGISRLHFFGDYPNPSPDDAPPRSVIWTNLSTEPDPLGCFVRDARSPGPVRRQKPIDP